MIVIFYLMIEVKRFTLKLNYWWSIYLHIEYWMMKLHESMYDFLPSPPANRLQATLFSGSLRESFRPKVPHRFEEKLLEWVVTEKQLLGTVRFCGVRQVSGGEKSSFKERERESLLKLMQQNNSELDHTTPLNHGENTTAADIKERLRGEKARNFGWTKRTRVECTRTIYRVHAP